MDDLLSTLEEFEAEIKHTIGDDMRSSKVIHMIRNRFAMSTDLVKYELLDAGMTDEQVDVGMKVLRRLDEKFLSLGED